MIRNIFFKIKYFVYYTYLNKDKNILLHRSVLINNNTVLEGYNSVSKFSDIRNSSLGKHTYIGQRSYIKDTIIGKYCSIGNDVHIVAGSHPVSEFVSTHPIFYSKKYSVKESVIQKQKFSEYKFIDMSKHLVKIGNDVWIGASVNIIDGVTIGDGAIIGANSLVMKDVEPYSIYAGVPAKLIGYRFEKHIISQLVEFEWWNKSKSWIKDNAEVFDNTEEFLKLISKKRS